MKTKNVLKLIVILIAVVGINFAGCKKDRTKPIPNPDTSSLQQLSKDDSQVQASDNEILNDANSVLSSSSNKSMDTTIVSCSISVDSLTHGDTIVYTLIYNNYNTVHGFIRNGTVLIEKHKGVHWRDAGATVIFEYVNLAITKISSGKTFTFNGTRQFENVLGYRIIDLGASGGPTSVEFQLTGAMQITFDNGTTRTWTISKQRTWTGTYPGSLIVTDGSSGASAGGYNNLIEYGTNRNGEEFYTQIPTPIIYSENCGYGWIPIWGVLIHQIPSVPKSATLTFGYNSSDNLVTQGACADNYRLDWNIKGKTGTIYLSIP